MVVFDFFWLLLLAGGELDTSSSFSLRAHFFKKLMMKTLILLLGSLGLASGATFAKPNNYDFASKEGCKYGAQQVRNECSFCFVDVSLSLSDFSLIESIPSRNVPFEWNASRMQTCQKVDDAIVTHSGSRFLQPCHSTTANGTMDSLLAIARTTI